MKALFIFFLISCLYSPVMVGAQNRNVIWLHGLEENGDFNSNNFWQNYAASFARERAIVSTNLDYNSAAGVRTMAQEVVRRTNGNANNIGIGHSMGGVALREINANTARNHVGGIITVGSPLNGARIVNAWQNGEVRAYIDHSVDELLKGPRREFFVSYIIVNTATRKFTGRDLGELVKDLVFDNMPLELLEGQSPADLAEGSPYMNIARMYSSNTPKVSIYGSEDRPVHLRLLSSARNQPDDHFPGIARTARGVYNGFYIKNIALSYNIVNAYQAAGWKAGRDYLDEKSETGWNNMINATRTESAQNCYSEFVCPDYSCYDNIVTYEDYLACQTRCYQEVCRTTTVRYNQPSDGLLHQSTQTGERTQGVRSMWYPNNAYEARGANHNEYDEHVETREILNDIFAGTIEAPPFFITQ